MIWSLLWMRISTTSLALYDTVDTCGNGLTTNEEPLLIDTCGSGFGVDDLVPVMDEDLHHHIGKLDVHDGGHSLLLCSQQRRPEAHSQVRHSHQVL
jgi:hypothetical protein